jgi:hypothetical protein
METIAAATLGAGAGAAERFLAAAWAAGPKRLGGPGAPPHCSPPQCST